jgi:hypothetical protein
MAHGGMPYRCPRMRTLSRSMIPSARSAFADNPEAAQRSRISPCERVSSKSASSVWSLRLRRACRVNSGMASLKAANWSTKGVCPVFLPVRMRIRSTSPAARRSSACSSTRPVFPNPVGASRRTGISASSAAARASRVRGWPSRHSSNGWGTCIWRSREKCPRRSSRMVATDLRCS